MPTWPIKNASDNKLDQNPGTLPDMSDVITNYFQLMVFNQLTKKMVNFKIQEIQNRINFRGVMQPFTDQQLKLKPEGQRAWSWYWLHSDTTLILNPDDVVFYLGIQYRVMAKKDWSQYGYLEYHLILGYKGDESVINPL